MNGIHRGIVSAAKSCCLAPADNFTNLAFNPSNVFPCSLIFPSVMVCTLCKSSNNADVSYYGFSVSKVYSLLQILFNKLFCWRAYWIFWLIDFNSHPLCFRFAGILKSASISRHRSMQDRKVELSSSSLCNSSSTTAILETADLASSSFKAGLFCFNLMSGCNSSDSILDNLSIIPLSQISDSYMCSLMVSTAIC